jgi:transcriptional regulator NrdR family protein
MNFILDAQAKAEVRMAAHDEAIAKIEKQLQATANLLRAAVRVGSRQLRRLSEQQRITDQKFAELAESQRITDQKFQAFMQAFGKGTNGN